MNGLLIRNSFVCLKRSFAALYFAWLVKMCSVHVHTMSPAQRLTEKPYESSCGVIRLVSSKVQTHFNDPLFSCLFSFFALHTPICERTIEWQEIVKKIYLNRELYVCSLFVYVSHWIRVKVLWSFGSYTYQICKSLWLCACVRVLFSYVYCRWCVTTSVQVRCLQPEYEFIV